MAPATVFLLAAGAGLVLVLENPSEGAGAWSASGACYGRTGDDVRLVRLPVHF